MSTVRCTPNVKDRMTDVARLYHNLLQSGAIVAPPGSDPSQYAILLMTDAFRSPPVLHVPADVWIPVHCWESYLLENEAFSNLVTSKAEAEIISYTKERIETRNQLWFAFLTHSGVAELENPGPIVAAANTFLHCSRLSCGSTVGRFLCEASNRLHETVPPFVSLFGSSTIPSSRLCGRSAVWLLVGVCLCSASDRVQILQHIVHALKTDEACATFAIKLMSTFPVDLFSRLVDEFQLYLTVELMSTGNVEALDVICTVLSLLYRANYVHLPRDGVISHIKFYNGFTDEFSDDDIREDFIRLINNEFAFSKYPFLINARFKSVLLQLEASVERDGALRQAIVTNLFTNRGNEILEDFFCVLRVDRHNIVDSTLREVRRKSSLLRRPLRIQFIGEEGVDEGGLKKEFFQLLTRELLHPNYNMFTVAEGSRCLWFAPSIQNSANRAEFQLVGQIIGLAVYNNIIIDVAFPMAVFRKLLGVPLTFQDLNDVDPSLHNGMELLLNFKESDGVTIEDVFCRTFIFEHEVFGQKVDAPLIPGGEAIILTRENRQQFVDAVVQYVLCSSIEENFSAFREGFFSVCTRSLLTTLRPEELDQLVVGNRVLDFAELERCTVYEGFIPGCLTIRYFWEVLHEFSEDQKKKFLRFCTGSDRIPVGGLRDLHFIVGKNGDDTEKLPTSHTCFNHLLLPEYASREKLKEKLLLAIENCEGFYGGK